MSMNGWIWLSPRKKSSGHRLDRTEPKSYSWQAFLKEILMRHLAVAAFVIAVLACPPVHAQQAAPAQQAAAPAAAADPGASEAQISKMRERWRKMPAQQREEMRQKAERRLKERYERLSPQEQAQINTLHDEIAKLNKEQRSIFRAQYN